MTGFSADFDVYRTNAKTDKTEVMAKFKTVEKDLKKNSDFSSKLQ